MKVQVTGQHVEITAALRSFIEGKLAKLEEFYPALSKAAVVVSVEKYRHTAEIQFNADGVPMIAKKTTKDMYASLEGAVAALEQQASKRKDRLHTSAAHRRTAAREEKRGRKRASEAGRDAGEPKAKVVRVRADPTRALPLDEAVEILTASGEAHLLFRDPRSGAVRLLFRRGDGNLGLTEA